MKVVAIVSGGMDSTTLLYCLRDEGHEVKALGFDYGQRHRRELDHARQICEYAGIPFEVVDLQSVASLFTGESALTNKNFEVPHGHYEDKSMKATVVPNRNMIMLALATGHAVSLGYDAVAFGAHSGDHAIYPDCRKVFTEAMDRAMSLCDFREIRLLRPFVGIDKTAIVRKGKRLGVPFWMTWSCYEGGELHCGKCGTCVERKEAFQKAEVEDPTAYKVGTFVPGAA